MPGHSVERSDEESNLEASFRLQALEFSFQMTSHFVSFAGLQDKQGRCCIRKHTAKKE